MRAAVMTLPPVLLLLLQLRVLVVASASVQEIHRGFSIMHAPSYSQFQPVLSDPTGVFSLGFLRLNATLLDLAILHLPSSLPLWRAIPHSPALWSGATALSFDGNLLLSDHTTGTALWSTASDDGGDRVILLNSSNLQIHGSKAGAIVWQSFDFPSDTIVQNQNFTSAAALFSSNRQFSMRLGPTYFALFMELQGAGNASPMYLKHTALQAKAQIVPGRGPIYARVDPEGFLGIYQREGPPADVVSFDTFNRGVRGFRRLTLESDGNLRAYLWNASSWILDYAAISDPCELPTTCGGYEMCVGYSSGAQCTCLVNGTRGCIPAGSGDTCGSSSGGAGQEDFWVVRRRGVDLANKEVVGFEKVGSVEECEGACERNCSCWGAVYSNTTGYCYRMDYPVRLLVQGDDRKLGYFKVRRAQEDQDDGNNKAKGALLVVGIVIIAAAAGFGACRILREKRISWLPRKHQRDGRGDIITDDGSLVATGPYKNLASSSSASFNSIELSSSSSSSSRN